MIKSFSTGQLLVYHCCPCGASWSINCSDGASSCARKDGRESEQHDTGVLGVLACLRKAWQCDRRQNSDGVLWDLKLVRDQCSLQLPEFLMWSCQQILDIWHWHLCGKPPDVVHRPRVVHVSQAYKRMGKTRIPYTRSSLIMRGVDSSRLVAETDDASAMLRVISAWLLPADDWVLPRYINCPLAPRCFHSP